jgi:hypothetical protein
LELCITQNREPESFIGETIKDDEHSWTVDAQRAERVSMCLNYIERRKPELAEQFPGSTITVEAETRSNPGAAFGRDDWWGTVDITIQVFINDVQVFLEIIDYKDGRGFVSANDNSQLQGYAFGKLEEAANVRMTIVQPKTSPVVRYSDVPAELLIHEATQLSIAAAATDDPDAPLQSGKHCEWCKANPKRGGNCTMGVQQVDTTNLEKDVTTLTDTELSQLLDTKDKILAAFDRVESEIQERLNTGVNIPGYAMRPGRSSYSFDTEREAELVKKLKARRMKTDDIYPKKLITPAQLKKSDKLTSQQLKTIVDEFVVEKAGKLKLTKVKHEISFL